MQQHAEGPSSQRGPALPRPLHRPLQTEAAEPRIVFLSRSSLLALNSQSLTCQGSGGGSQELARENVNHLARGRNAVLSHHERVCGEAQRSPCVLYEAAPFAFAL